MHLREGVLDAVQRDRLADETVQVKPTLQVHVDEHREVAGGQAVAVPARLQRTTAAEEVEQRHLQPHLRCWYADKDHGAGKVARVERLAPGLRPTNCVNSHVDPEPPGEI